MGQGQAVSEPPEEVSAAMRRRVSSDSLKTAMGRAACPGR